MTKNYYILTLQLLQMFGFARITAAAESPILNKTAIAEEAAAIIKDAVQQEGHVGKMWEEARDAWTAMGIRDYDHPAVILINDLYASTRCIQNNNKNTEIFSKNLQNALDQNDIETAQAHLSILRKLHEETAEQLKPAIKVSPAVKLERLKALANHTQQERRQQQIKSSLQAKKNEVLEKSDHLVGLALQRRVGQLFSAHPVKGPQEKLQHGELPSIRPGTKILLGLMIYPANENYQR